MPIKRITCCICHQEVNKAQTYHVGDGKRACKSHEGVTKTKENLVHKEAQKLQHEVRRTQERQERREYKQNHDSEPFQFRCAVCRNPGMRSDKFFTRVLIEKSKAEQIYGPLNPFDFKHPGNQLKIAERCIFVLTRDKLDKVVKFIHGDFRQILDLMGIAGVCGPCCQRNGIDPMPKIEFEEILRFAAYSEIVVKPVVDAIARQEMSTSN